MKFLSSVLLASAASAVSINLGKRESPLDVKLEMLGNSEVKATISNTGTADLKLFKPGSILDTAEIEKVNVFTGGMSKHC
jgi:deuterolysin